MDELSIIVEGVGNKIKRLIIRNKQLKDQYLSLQEEKEELQEKIGLQAEEIQHLEEQLATLKVARVLEGGDPVLARQKVNDLLREIEKCQVLLNR